MKKIVSFFLILVILCSFVGCGNKASIEDHLTYDSEFQSFSNQYLLDLFGDDLLSWNSITKDPSTFGYSRPSNLVASFYEYEDFHETQENVYSSALEIQEKLNSFQKNKLSYAQTKDYESIKFINDLNLEASKPTTTWFILTLPDFISQYGGYVAEFTNSIENMKLRNEQDVIDMINITSSTSTVFQTYLNYVSDRDAEEFPLSDFTIESMQSFLLGIEEKGESYYLISFIAKMIDSLDFLDLSKKETYKEQFKNAILNQFIPACTSLRNGLDTYKGRWEGTNETNLVHYGSKCSGYYLYKLQSELGESISNLSSYENKLSLWYTKSSEQLNSIVRRIQKLDETSQKQVIDMLNAEDSFLGFTTAEEIMDFLLENSSTIVRDLETQPDITIKYTDETVSEYAVYVAYYILSPFDEKYSPIESVTLNPAYTSSLLGEAFTLAHEGYPGHLYQHVYEKQKNISPVYMLLSTHGASEGWAQYAAYTLLMNYAKTLEEGVTRLAIEYYCTSQLNDYVYSCYMEYLVNYYGMTSEYLEMQFGVPEDEAIETVHFYSENVCGLAPYGYGMAIQLDLHEKTKTALGAKYNELEYNEYLMISYGMFGIDSLRDSTTMFQAIKGQ